MTPVETIEHESGVVAKIYQDDDPSFADPRQDDQLGVMYCWHPDYVLGDEQFTRADHDSMEEVATYLFRDRDAIVVIPLFLLDHSGISMRCGRAMTNKSMTAPDVEARNRFIGDEAGWDTTTVGFIYATKARKDELGVPDGVEEVERQLRGEVKEYDQYLRGEVYTVVVEDADGETLDSCGGFLGWVYAAEEAARMLKDGVEEAQREKDERQFWLEREVVTVG